MNHLLAVDIRSTFFGTQNVAKIAQTPGTLITGLMPNIILIAGLVLFVLIVNSAFHILSDSGSTNAQVMAKHRSQLTMAVIGFLIVFASYFILQFVLNTLGIGTTINSTI